MHPAYERILAGKARAALTRRYNLDTQAIISPKDMPVEIYSEAAYGAYWCHWNDWALIRNGMWILSHNNFFVWCKKRHHRQNSPKVEVITPHGTYNNTLRVISRKLGTRNRDYTFDVYFPIPKWNEDGSDKDGLGRMLTPALTGYKRSVKDMAVLLAYGLSRADAFAIAFRGKRGQGKGGAENLTLDDILRRPDLIEELKVELKEAFAAKGITQDWLVDQLRAVGENQAHKSQMEVLFMIGRVIGCNLDTFAKSADEGFGGMMLGYAARQSITDGQEQVQEAVVVGQPESVRKALEQGK